MPRRRAPLLLALSLLALCVVPRAFAGDDKLGDFEGALERESRDDDRPARRDDDREDVSWGGGFGPPPSHFANRTVGEPAAALARLEGTFQWLEDSDVEGYVIRGELIYDRIGIAAEFIDYHEGEPSQSLEFGSAELLIRLVPNRHVRLNFALGARHITGRNDRTGVTGGFSLGLYPIEWVGLEVDARWTDVAGRALQDYRGGLLMRIPAFPHLAVRGGYRSIGFRGETLHGPEVGAVLTW